MESVRMSNFLIGWQCPNLNDEDVTPRFNALIRAWGGDTLRLTGTVTGVRPTELPSISTRAPAGTELKLIISVERVKRVPQPVKKSAGTTPTTNRKSIRILIAPTYASLAIYMQSRFFARSYLFAPHFFAKRIRVN